ncbi:MAG: hypothetical protein E7057_02765 [Lentisphaerae bacterium]|nr:hypothetical protein [Lentisphaerota bacterium]
MKKIIFAAVLFCTAVLTAAEVPLYPVAKKQTPATCAAWEENGGMYRIAFKLPADTEADFGIVNVYIFADNDRTTGRKNMGNEYFLDVTKSMVSTYSADGKGTLHRKAVTAVRDGEWYILSFSKNLAPDTPLKEFEIVFADKKGKRDRVNLRGNALEKAVLPAVK